MEPRTGVALILASFDTGPEGEPVRVTSAAEAARTFGTTGEGALQAASFFVNGGREALLVRAAPGAVVDVLPTIEGNFGMLCVPEAATLGPDADAVWAAALGLCYARRAMLLVDPPELPDAAAALHWLDARAVFAGSGRAAIYYPRLKTGDSAHVIGASGAVAGVYARMEEVRGIWKAPAGIEAVLREVDVVRSLPQREQELLNPRGVNVIRVFPGSGAVVWGARTQDRDDWKYVPVRRLADSIADGLLADPAGAEQLLYTLWRHGAFQGSKPEEAYFLREDEAGQVTIGFAPLRPAEFVILRIAIS